MENYEIEKKWLVKDLPDLNSYPCHHITQAYLCTDPVIRIRRSDEEYYMTYKGKGLMMREEYNLPLNAEAYEHMLEKADGNIIDKKRYVIPYGPYTIELDVFTSPITDIIAEVEFPNIEEAESFVPPEWFGKEVTGDPYYYNSNMSKMQKKIGD